MEHLTGLLALAVGVSVGGGVVWMMHRDLRVPMRELAPIIPLAFIATLVIFVVIVLVVSQAPDLKGA